MAPGENVQLEDHHGVGNAQRLEIAGTTMRWRQVGRNLVLVHSVDPIARAEWEGYCHTFASQRPSGVLVFVPPRCPGPNADLRRALSSAINKAGRPPIAVMTHSSLHRHIITAMNWFSGDNIRAFAPDNLEAALGHMRIGDADRGPVLAAAKELAQQLKVNTEFAALS